MFDVLVADAPARAASDAFAFTVPAPTTATAECLVGKRIPPRPGPCPTTGWVARRGAQHSDQQRDDRVAAYHLRQRTVLNFSEGRPASAPKFQEPLAHLASQQFLHRSPAALPLICQCAISIPQIADMWTAPDPE